MRFALFYHSVRSDWNHGNAHFLRGMVRALAQLGHDAICYEERRNWSVSHLVEEHGLAPLVDFRRRFPFIKVQLYDLAPLRRLERRLAAELADVDVVILHEWPAVETPALVDLLVRLRRSCGFTLLFHDTHYRLLSETEGVLAIRPERFDAILAYGPSLAAEYRRLGLGEVHVMHEAADTALFRPSPVDAEEPSDDALFIGNWGDRDRAEELTEYLLKPARKFMRQRRFAIYGVRYPPEVLEILHRRYGVDYRGWLPNAQVPAAYARTRVALHVVRRQYMKALPGIPTIRVFEALACGVPLISTRWLDTDALFVEGEDYLVVDSRKDMEEALDWLWHDAAARAQFRRRGLARIHARHTCRHRVDQLLSIVLRLRRGPRAAVQAPLGRPAALSPAPAAQPALIAAGG